MTIKKCLLFLSETLKKKKKVQMKCNSIYKYILSFLYIKKFV